MFPRLPKGLNFLMEFLFNHPSSSGLFDYRAEKVGVGYWTLDVAGKKETETLSHRELAMAANLQVIGGKAPINVCINMSRRLNLSLEIASRGGHI